MTAYYRTVRTVGWPLTKLIFWFKGHRRENIPKEGGFILCCNHTSYLDIAFLVLTCKRPIYFMAKEELFANPFMGWFYRHMGGFPIKRGGGDTAAMEKAEEIVRRGDILGIFPEGTRTKDPEGRPMRAKSGVAVIAAATGANVLPAAINYHGRVKPFRRIDITYGDIISNEQLHIEENSRADLKRATNTIMGAVTALWEGMGGPGPKQAASQKTLEPAKTPAGRDAQAAGQNGLESTGAGQGSGQESGQGSGQGSEQGAGVPAEEDK